MEVLLKFIEHQRILIFISSPHEDRVDDHMITSCDSLLAHAQKNSFRAEVELDAVRFSIINPTKAKQKENVTTEHRFIG